MVIRILRGIAEFGITGFNKILGGSVSRYTVYRVLGSIGAVDNRGIGGRVRSGHARAVGVAMTISWKLLATGRGV
jgi:hypothetical protein